MKSRLLKSQPTTDVGSDTPGGDGISPWPTRTCVEQRASSLPSLGDEVKVVGMPPGRTMFASSRWGKGKLTMPLVQPEVIEADEATREAVEDLLDRVGMGDESWKAHGRRD